jgi:hypothetical protein
MRNRIKVVLLVCTALTALSLASCNAFASLEGQNLPGTVWIRLTPAAPVLVGETWTAEIVLDFSKAIKELTDDMSVEELNKLITFDYAYYKPSEKKLEATAVKQYAEAVYRLTVKNIPANGGLATVNVNKTGISPPSRLWSLDGRALPEADASAALIDFRFVPGDDNPTLGAEAIAGIDQRQGKVAIIVPLNTKLSPLKPSILTNWGNTYTPPDATNFSSELAYTVTSSKTQEVKNYAVRVIVQTADSARIYIFGFSKEDNADYLDMTVSGDIDEGASPKTISVTVPYGTDRRALKPRITHSGASIEPLDMEAVDFSAPVDWTVRSANGTVIVYRVTVTEGAAPPEAALPEIGAPPRSGIYGVHEPLVAAASVDDGGTLSYRWFSNGTESNTGGVLVEGADTAVYPQIGVAGSTIYYYVEVTNTAADGATKTVTSTAAKVEVKSLKDRIAAEVATGATAAIILYGDEDFEKTVDTEANITNNSHITLVGGFDGSGTEERTLQLTGTGVMFMINGGASLTLDNNVTLKGHDSNTASLVSVNADGTLLVKSGSKITGNSSSQGGGVAVVNGGSFTMKSGEISRNEADVGETGYGGGGVSVINNGTFTMEGGEISGNKTGSYGGGVAVGYGSFTMKSGEISRNEAGGSGGGVAGVYGAFTMEGGEISGNEADRGGGGVVINLIFYMNGGVISGNKCTSTDDNMYRGGGGVLFGFSGGIRKTGNSIIYGSDAPLPSLENNAANGNGHAFLRSGWGYDSSLIENVDLSIDSQG